jgi:hypothetical protein
VTEPYEPFLRAQLSRAVTDAIATLLGSKHLYQNVDVAAEFLENHLTQTTGAAKAEAERKAGGIHFSGGGGRKEYVADAERQAGAKARRLIAEIAAAEWEAKPLPHDPPPPVHSAESSITFEVPTIQVFCSTCDARWPFSPGANAHWGQLRPMVYTLFAPQRTKPEPTKPQPVTQRAIPSPLFQSFFPANLSRGFLGPGEKTSQLLLLPYQCPQCKGCPVTFLVRRSALKVTLVGRDPIELVKPPAALPKQQAEYFSNAMIAHNAGQTLAALFLLRTFIEQYWYTLDSLPAAGAQRVTGDELGQAYSRTLPEDFRSRFPSLSDLYGRLSIALHTADPSAALFESAAADITTHFEARRLFKLDRVK